MLTRRRVLLHLLHLAGRPLAQREVMAWAFWLRGETPSRGGSAFYDFLPRQGVPHSFTLERELEAMAGEGLVLATDEEHWALAPGVDASGVPEEVEKDLGALVQHLRDMSERALLRHIAKAHPRFASPRPQGRIAIHTAGYEGLSVEGFLDLLLENGIERLLDVRANPTARRFGFHKSTLARLCSEVGVEYQHLPALGIPSRERQEVHTPEERRRMFERYERKLLPAEPEAIEQAAEAVREKPSVLVCLEADHKDCHRSRLARRLAEETGLETRELREENWALRGRRGPEGPGKAPSLGTIRR